MIRRHVRVPPLERSALHIDVREQAVQPAWEPPGPVAGERHQHRHHQEADEECVDEDAEREREPDRPDDRAIG